MRREAWKCQVEEDQQVADEADCLARELEQGGLDTACCECECEKAKD